MSLEGGSAPLAEEQANQSQELCGEDIFLKTLPTLAF